jgi:hypothetical protein
VGVSSFDVLLALLVATCLVIPGEQLRRGNIGPSGQPQTTLLPKASNVSQFRTLGIGWHATWAVVGLGVALVLVGIPAASALTGRWPVTLWGAADFSSDWALCGLVGLGIAFAALTSLYKKLHYRTVLSRRGPTALGGTARAAVWAWLTFRWRLDLWASAVGGMVAGLAGATVSLVDWNSTGDRGPASIFMCILLAVALALVVLGLWMASNFWKAGKPLGAGESYA